MGHRLSYASSPESDVEMRNPGLYDDDDDEVMPAPRGQRLVRSSSDPSINTAENIPGIPPYPAPPIYRDPRYDGPYDRSNYYHPYDRYDRQPHPHHHRGNYNIPPKSPVKLCLRIMQEYVKPPVWCAWGIQLNLGARWQHFTSSLPANVCPEIKHKSSLISWINLLFYLIIDERYTPYLQSMLVRILNFGCWLYGGSRIIHG